MAMEKAGTFQKDPNPTARGAEWSQGQDLEAGLCQSPDQCHVPAVLRTRHGLPLAQSNSRTDTSSHTGSRGRGTSSGVFRKGLLRDGVSLHGPE